jgi:hypothetical protein
MGLVDSDAVVDDLDPLPHSVWLPALHPSHASSAGEDDGGGPRGCGRTSIFERARKTAKTSLHVASSRGMETRHRPQHMRLFYRKYALDNATKERERKPF